MPTFPPNPEGRIIAVGDIHGCATEFAELLDRLRLTPADRLILLGDLVNRGPDSPGVIALARQARAISLKGNHEIRLLTYRRTQDPTLLKDTDRLTYDKLSPDDWAYLGAMQLTHYEPTLDTVFVHGGFLPGIPWQEQSADIVTRIQVIDAQGQPRKRADTPNSPIWADLWNGPPFVVYGHTPRYDIYATQWALGLDTACAMGGFLTAYILPEKRCIQVRAKQRYYGVETK